MELVWEDQFDITKQLNLVPSETCQHKYNVALLQTVSNKDIPAGSTNHTRTLSRNGQIISNSSTLPFSLLLEQIEGLEVPAEVTDTFLTTKDKRNQRILSVGYTVALFDMEEGKYIGEKLENASPIPIAGFEKAEALSKSKKKAGYQDKDETNDEPTAFISGRKLKIDLADTVTHQMLVFYSD